MVGEWMETTWGELATLEYGKALQGYVQQPAAARVFGTNGPIGWHGQSLWQGPGVVIGRKGAYRGVHYTRSPYWVIDTAYSLQAKLGVRLHPRWAYYQVKHLDPNTIDDGSPIPSTTRPSFYAQPVGFPSYEEQERIADALGALDDKIDLNQRMAETLEATARALFKSWFIDFDPVRAKAGGRPTGLPDDLAAVFPDSLGEDGVPAGWTATPLTGIGRFLNGLALQKYEPGAGEPWLPVIKISELRAGPTEKSGRASVALPPDYIIADGDHLFSWSGSLIHCRWTYGKGALNQHLFKVTPRGVPSWLTYQVVERHLPEFQAIAAGKAVTMGHIQRHHLDEAIVPLPPASALKSLDDIFAPLHARILTALLQNRTLAALRDTLLPKLISGELRIRDAEHAVAAA